MNLVGVYTVLLDYDGMRTKSENSVTDFCITK